MTKILDWDDYIGRRIKLRDLRVFFLVVQHGSFGKTAAQLRVSQPAVSRVIVELERSLGVQLFDRTPRGVEPTLYGRALLARGRAAFDELKQGFGDIEFLSDPGAGQVSIGSPDVLLAGFIGAIIDRLARDAPRVAVRAVIGDRPSLSIALRERQLDIMVSRRPATIPEDDLASTMLFDEQLFIVGGLNNKWTRRRKIDLSELVNEHWVLPPSSSITGALIAQSFHTVGIAPPKPVVACDSIILRTRLLATGRYLSVLPGSLLRYGTPRPAVKILSVELAGMIQPTEITILKRRTLSPAVQRFIKTAHEVAKSIDHARN